jgi:hypothetical protein
MTARGSASKALRYAMQGGVPGRSLRVALVVGTVLTLINQGDAILATARVDWLKALLTYAVPYAVSTYGAVSFRMSLERDAGRG